MERPHRSLDSSPPLSLLPPPREALFLDDGVARNLRALLRDFCNFTLVVVFYASCWSLGSVAFMLDNMFHTQLFERFIRLVEYLDHGGRR